MRTFSNPLADGVGKPMQRHCTIVLLHRERESPFAKPAALFKIFVLIIIRKPTTSSQASPYTKIIVKSVIKLEA